MTANTSLRTLVTGVLALVSLTASVSAQKADQPLALRTGRITINGTSNVHDYEATSTAVRLLRVAVAQDEGGNALEAALSPGSLTAFEIAVAAPSMSSPREGLDKNMHKALKAQAHPDITFRLTRLEPAGTAGAFAATGMLTIAGVERQVVLPLTTARAGTAITVRGEIPLVMTDFKVTPPKAMLGMIRTDPKVKVSFEVVLDVPQV